MKFTADEQAAILDALGEDAVVAGGLIRGNFQAPGEVFDGIGGIITTSPSVLVAEGDVSVYGLIGGEDGSAITIGGTDYVILSVVPKGNGFSTLTLEITN